MVCKEELFLWFRNLKGSKRIEAMCGLLNMCYPLELRFYGTCLEDLGRRDFYTLRDEEVKSNNVAEILKIRNINDPYTRSRLIVILSLLNSSNMACSKELFKVLTEEIKIESMASLGTLSNAKIVEELLLLLALAQNHPAFTFEQQTLLSELSLSLENSAKEINSRTRNEYDEESSLSSPGFNPIGISSASEKEMLHTQSYPQYSIGVPYQKSTESHYYPVRITSLKVKPPHKKMCIRIRVSWCSNKTTDTFKTPHDITVFHQNLTQLYPSEIQATNQEKFIPPLPYAISTWNKQNILTEAIISSISEYIQQLNMRLPDYILESEFVTNFFMPSFHNRSVMSRNKMGDGAQVQGSSRNPRLRSFTFYNSQMSDKPSGHHSEGHQRVSHHPLHRKISEGNSIGKSPVNSPLQSPLSSPYASPANSETNSRSASPWSHRAAIIVDRGICGVSEAVPLDKLVIKEQVHDPWEIMRSYRIEELHTMPTEEFESAGTLRDARNKLGKVLDNKSSCAPLNGVIGNYVPKSAFPIKPLLQHPTSNDSSPVCSEYSSPPQSPSPGEGYNQSTSSNEENIDKRPQPKPATDLGKIEDNELNIQDLAFKRPDDEAASSKGSLSRSSLSLLSFPVAYNSISQIPPPQNIKPSYLPIPCRTNSAPQHITPGTVVFDNQYSRVPLPSALTFLPGAPRSHAVTPDRILPPTNLPISTVTPFPVTSGCVTLPSATCSITTHKSSNITAVTNSGMANSKHSQKNSPPLRDNDAPKSIQQPAEAPYAAGYILASSAQLTAVSCSCFSTTNSARPSPAPSPSLSPGATPQPSAVPASMPYLGMSYVFHHTMPFLQAQAPANGFVPQPGLASPGQGFSYALPNGITAIPPELMYPGQTFTLQSPSSQGNPGQVATPASQCFTAFPQAAAVPLKLISCFNCGKIGHRGPDCKEQTMDELSKPGKFQLNYNPIPKIPESHE